MLFISHMVFEQYVRFLSVVLGLLAKGFSDNRSYTPASTAVNVPPGLVPHSAISGEKFPHLSPQLPATLTHTAPTLPSNQKAPFCPGLFVSSLHFCALHVLDKGWRVSHRHLSQRYGENASLRYGLWISSLHIHSNCSTVWAIYVDTP